MICEVILDGGARLRVVRHTVLNFMSHNPSKENDIREGLCVGCPLARFLGHILWYPQSVGGWIWGTRMGDGTDDISLCS